MMTNNTELRMILDRDLNNLNFNKNKRANERNDTYKYGNDNAQKVIKDEIPEWARKVLSNPKPGEIIGQFSQDDLRNKLNKE